MTNKAQTILFACLSGFSGFVNWLCTLAPEQQEGYAAALVELVPLHWRPNVGVATRLLMFFLGILTAYKASQTVPAQLAGPAAKVLLVVFACFLFFGCSTTTVTRWEADGKTVTKTTGVDAGAFAAIGKWAGMLVGAAVEVSLSAQGWNAYPEGKAVVIPVRE